MAITTYAELKTAVANWLDRSDLSSRIIEFIAMWEAKVNRRLRVRQMVTSTTLTPSSGSATLPTDYLEWVRVTWTGDVRRELQWVEPTFLQSSFPTRPTGDPQYFTIEGSTLKIMPLSTTALEFVYYQKVPALSDSATSNWLLVAAPDAYLFGALTEASGYSEDISNGGIWDVRAKEALDELTRLSSFSRGQATQRTLSPMP